MHQLDAGFTVTQLDYREDVPFPLKSTESGLFPGVHGGYRFMLPDGINHFGASIGLSSATTTYDGSTMRGAPVIAETSNVVFEGQIEYGREVTPDSLTNRWSPYVGLGMHFWKRDLSGAPGGYAERYLWMFLPVGVRYQHFFDSAWNIGFDASFRVNLGGWISVDFPQFDNVPTSSGSLGSAIGGRIQIPVEYRATEMVAFSLAPFFEYAGIGQGSVFQFHQPSGRISNAREPASRSLFIGSNVSARILF